MDPIAPPSPTASQPLVEFVRTQRQSAGAVLAILAVLFLGSAVFLFIQGGKVPKAAEKTAEKSKIEEPDSPDKLEQVNPRRADYRWGAALTLIAGLASGVLALWLMAGLPAADEAAQLTTARMQILAVGAVFGLLLMAAGGIYFYQWVDSLGDAFEKGKEKELTWVVIPLLFVLAGAAQMLAAIQPARAEERNNPVLRRLVYGSNLALTAMLLLVVLVVGNVVISYRVSNKFDTTSSGFYSMSDQTQEFLASLDQPMNAYAILTGTGRRDETDLLDVLTRFQDASRDRLKVTVVNAITNSIELSKLKLDYPPVAEGTTGVLLTFANDPKRFSFIPTREFFEEERPSEMGQEPRLTFVGEGRLVRELLYLADYKQKPKVYFTQSSGELELSGNGEPSRMATQLQAYLEKNYLEVKPLTFDKDNPKVPEDCTVLFVADPQKTMPTNQVDAIRKYMTEPQPGGRKGKLIVVSGMPLPTPQQLRATVNQVPFILMLSQFNIGLSDKYLLAFSADRRIEAYSPPAEIAPQAINQRNPIARMFRGRSIPLFFPREVAPLNTIPALTATPLLITATEGGAWLEDQLPQDLDFERAAVMASKSGGLLRSRPAAAVVSEGTTPRLAVIGSNGVLLSDEIARMFRNEGPAFDLVRSIIDWLRDRPQVPAGVQAKTYSVYTLGNAKTVDKSRLEYLPIGLVLIAVSGIGLGVWITRRQQQ